MNRLRVWIRSFFGFSRTESNAFIILLPVMILLIFSEPIYRSWSVRRPHDFSAQSKRLDSIVATWKWEQPKTESKVKSSVEPKAKLFLFDPNQVSKEQLTTLGFTNSIATRIVNYRSKGGKFLVKKDLLKIYGIDSTFFYQLVNYINLPDQKTNSFVPKKFEPKEKPLVKSVAKFDLNKADTTQLKSIYGIGSKLSARIVTYRDRLGGFINSHQLREVYALDTAVIRELFAKAFIADPFSPKQLNINSASEKELGAHPYIKYKIAKAIVAYRFQHGAFQSVDDLKKIVLIDDAKVEQMRPYVSVSP